MIATMYDGDKRKRKQIWLSDELEQFIGSDKEFVKQLRQVEDFFDYAKERPLLIQPRLNELEESFRKYNPNVVEFDVIRYIQQEIVRKLENTEFYNKEVTMRFLSKKHKMTINR